MQQCKSTPTPARSLRARSARRPALLSAVPADCLAVVALAAALVFSQPALAAPSPPSSDPGRCAVSRLTDFAATRASFSAEVASGALPESVLDLRDCSFAKLQLGEAVLAGARLDGADFSGTDLKHADLARSTARRAVFAGASLEDANCFAVAFDGADMRGVNFTNAILSNATWKGALLEGAQLDGALLSRSDVRTLCEVAQLDDEGKAVLGCR